MDKNFEQQNCFPKGRSLGVVSFFIDRSLEFLRTSFDEKVRNGFDYAKYEANDSFRFVRAHKKSD